MTEGAVVSSQESAVRRELLSKLLFGVQPLGHGSRVCVIVRARLWRFLKILAYGLQLQASGFFPLAQRFSAGSAVQSSGSAARFSGLPESLANRQGTAEAVP